MDIRQLEVFLALARTLNFTQVAKQFHISQPAITLQLKELERYFGATLLYRTSHSVRLTAEGEELCRGAEQALTALENSHRRISCLAQGKAGLLRISVVQASVGLATDCLRRLHERYPDVSVDVEIQNGQQQIDSAGREEFDFYFSMSRLLEVCGGLECMPMETVRFGLLMRKEDARGVDPADFSTLSGMTFVSESVSEAPFLTERAMELCRRRGFMPKRTRWCDSALSVLVTVSSGGGFAVFPMSLTWNGSVENLTLLPIPGEDALSVSAVGWPAAACGGAALHFREILEESSDGASDGAEK